MSTHKKIFVEENNPRKRTIRLIMWVVFIALVVFATAFVLILQFKTMMYIFAILGALATTLIAVIGIKEIFAELFESILDALEKRKL